MLFSSCHKHRTRQKKTFFLFLYRAQNLPTVWIFVLVLYHQLWEILWKLFSCKNVYSNWPFFTQHFTFPYRLIFFGKHAYIPRKLLYPGRSTNHEISGAIWNARGFPNSPYVMLIFLLNWEHLKPHPNPPHLTPQPSELLWSWSLGLI